MVHRDRSQRHVLFTSPPVATTLNVLTTLSTVDLGNLDTTGFALGVDTITVTVADSSGNPIPGATGTGSLLIGTPVSATLSTSPTSLPAGSGTVTETLQIASQTSYTAPLGLLGETSIADRAASPWMATIAYVGHLRRNRRRRHLQPLLTQCRLDLRLERFPRLPVVALQVYNSELVALAQASGGTSQSS